MKFLYGKKGNATIIASLVAVGIGVGALLAYGQYSSVARKVRVTSQLELEAQFYATELLEFLRSMDVDQMGAYLRVNPMFPGTPPYPYCTHINLRDLANNTRINPDDVAELPSSALGGRNARRYYKVDIVNRYTLNVDNFACNQTPIQRPLTLNGDETYWITVFVDYTNTQNQTKSVVLSGITHESF